MKKMTRWQRQNCIKVLRFVSAAKPDQCYMPSYVVRDDTRAVPTRGRGEPDCGTAACLAGWGALLCAPTKDYKVSADVVTWDESRYAHGDDTLWVPERWARKHLSKSLLTNYHDRKKVRGVRWARVPISEIGRAVLGDTAARYFAPNARCVGEPIGPHRFEGETDQAYIIRAIREVIGDEP